MSPARTFTFIMIATLLMCLVMAEIGLRTLFNLGNPVLYQTHPDYGSRPKPNQKTKGANGAVISINNLGLRTSSDWATTSSTSNQTNILFLGDSVTYGGSYIDNQDLFTSQIERNINSRLDDNTQVLVGNAGVNGWGVENIYGLITLHKFLPASTYVTVLVEPDFYRAKTNIPFGWTSSPKLAIIQVGHFFYKRLQARIFKPKPKSPLLPNQDTSFAANLSDASFSHRNPRTAKKNARLLKELDTFFKQRQLSHTIVISPMKAQVNNTQTRDPFVYAALKEEGLAVDYLTDDIQEWLAANPHVTTDDIFHDVVHLTKTGHNVWATLLEPITLKALGKNR